MPIQTTHRQQQGGHAVLGEMDADRMTENLQQVGSNNNNKLHFDENDEKILNATLKAFQSGSLTPLIKEELRCTIQSRRIAEGKGEMQVEFKTPVRRKEMDADERGRALKRRQQNREAAQRFRQKQKDTSDYLTAKIRKLEKSSNALMKDMNRLKEEKELLGQMLKDHLTVCSNPHLINTTVVFDNTETNTTPVPQTPISSQPLLSASSSSSTTDSHFTYDDLSRPASTSSSSCDTSSSIVSPEPDLGNVDDHDPATGSFTQMLFDPTHPLHASTTENVLVYDGPLDGCYEEIIIDFGDTDAADMQDMQDMQNVSRARGDSCSSIDTVSSYYCSSTPELTPLTEVNTDLFSYNTSDFSHDHSQTDAMMLRPFGKMTTLPDDMFFIEDAGISI